MKCYVGTINFVMVSAAPALGDVNQDSRCLFGFRTGCQTQR
jgi:hypothetical protein